MTSISRSPLGATSRRHRLRRARPARQSLLHICAALAATLSPWLARAEPAPPFRDLLAAAQTTAPRLAEALASVQVAEGLADQAHAFPNPTLGVQVEDLGFKDVGVPQRQNTFQLSQPLELGGKRSARIGAGNAELAAARARQQQAVADFGYDLATAYAAAEAAQGRVTALTDDLGRARDDLRAVRAMVGAGKEADLRAVQAEAAAETAEGVLASARADLAAALADLTILVGAPQAFTEVGGSVLSLTRSAPPGGPSPLALAAAQADREAAARRLSAERALNIPDLNLSVGARTYERSNTTALVVGLSAPLPLFDRRRGSIKAAAAQLTGAEVRARAVAAQSAGAWTTALAQAEASQLRAAATEKSAAAAREGYRLSRIAYEAGKVSLIEVTAARRALAEADLTLLDARVARLRAQAQLARLAGKPSLEE